LEPLVVIQRLRRRHVWGHRHRKDDVAIILALGLTHHPADGLHHVHHGVTRVKKITESNAGTSTPSERQRALVSTRVWSSSGVDSSQESFEPRSIAFIAPSTCWDATRRSTLCRETSPITAASRSCCR